LNEVATATALYAILDESTPPQPRTYESPFSEIVWPSLTGQEYASAVSVGPAEICDVAEYGIWVVETPVDAKKGNEGDPILPDTPTLTRGEAETTGASVGVDDESGSPRLPDNPKLRKGVVPGLPLA